MPTFGQDFLKGFTATDTLRDYRHASRTFTTNSWELKPRFKFLYHVQFTINVDQIPSLRQVPIFQEQNIGNLSLLVKTIDLPKYTVANEVMNQYNRKRLVQTKINYDPISVTFHDDGGDNARELWYQYYSYYYKDPSQTYLNRAPNSRTSIGQTQLKQNGFDYNNRDIYEQDRVGNVNDWGFIGESYLQGPSTASGKPPFFKDIRIFGFDQHKYAQYVLINPIITAFAHDKYDYAQGDGIMENTMTIAYESVKYYNGALGKPDANVNWPISSHYDNLSSPLARPGSTATVFGQGGLLDTGVGILNDLEEPSIAGIIGAAQKAGATYNTFKGKSLRSVVQSEATALGKDTLRTFGPGATKQVINKADSWVFPTATTQRTVTRNLNSPGANQILGSGGGV
jgi:hypothetical protein